MGPPENRKINEILIAAVTPYFLERGVLWFKENFAAIKKSRNTSPLWKNSSLMLEQDLTTKPSELLRQLVDFGYEKTARIFGRGEFTWQGNILEIWPINMEHPARIEFFGNTIAEIIPFEREKITDLPKISFRVSLEKLPINSFIVHLDHGIGIFRGITTANEIRNPKSEARNKSKVQNQNTENGFEFRDAGIEFSAAKNMQKFFVVEYAPPREGAEPDRLLIPENQAKKLSPYIGFETPTVHRLGGTLWFSTKRKVKESAEKLAKALLELYKKRMISGRAAYELDSVTTEEFDAACAFDETPDQRRSTQDIDNDFRKNQPMDRIICGDVGFGKTEIAMRAAFRATLAEKQAALVTPTTILADQHLRNFRERFAKTPIMIAGLSRLTIPREIKETITKIANGQIDIVIGTHRLLSKDICFKNLGLVIIDEEQKFGVRQKERFKEMRGDVDILSLSATPIPRTLSFTLSKLKDISQIQTPPQGRVAIKTFVLPYAPRLICRAALAECRRGGQVYFLHNRVETMEFFKKKLAQLLPAVRIQSIHGRMEEKEIIKVMDDFGAKKFDVLVATTIIENGLDFSNVNTLIVEDASRLGLAQAHQIRGRIGRANVQAYAYFLYRSGHLTEKARERLTALQEFSELGSGYEIALRDLELRGAGNILGKEQSGTINKVGFNLYCQMLNEAMEDMTLA